MEINALTHKGKGIENCLRTPVKVTNPINGSVIQTLGIWDTGATNSVITKACAQQLGLKVVQYANVKGVHGSKKVPVYIVRLTLNNENITIRTLVTECESLSDNDDTGILIGMNVINMGDLSISNYNSQTILTFRTPSLIGIDYVAEITEYNKISKMHQTQRKHGSEKCPCGSGKLYKNCHGMSVYNK